MKLSSLILFLKKEIVIPLYWCKSGNVFLPTCRKDLLWVLYWNEKNSNKRRLIAITWSLSLLFQLVTSSDLLLDCQDGSTLSLKIFFQEKYYQIHLGRCISVFEFSQVHDISSICFVVFTDWVFLASKSVWVMDNW